MNNTELVQSYRQQIGNVVNQANLQLFWNMYNRYGRCGAQLCGPRHLSARSAGARGKRQARHVRSPVCRWAAGRSSEKSHCWL